MSNENNSEKEKENTFVKGWNDIASGFKGGFKKFQKTLEDQSKKSVEDWDKSKEKVNKFFSKMGENWNKQVAKWSKDVEDVQEQNKEQWEAKKQKIKDDIDKWQNQTREDWKDGVKSWNRGMIKGAFTLLIIVIPIIIVLVLVIYVINQALNLMPG